MGSDLPLPLFHSDLSGLCHWANEALLKLAGLELSQLRGQFWLKLVHPDDRTRAMNEWDEAMAKRTACSASLRLQRSTGQTIEAVLHATPLSTSGRGGEFCIAWFELSQPVELTTIVEEPESKPDPAQEKINKLEEDLRRRATVETELREEWQRTEALLREKEELLQAATQDVEAERLNIAKDLAVLKEQLSKSEQEIQQEKELHHQSMMELRERLEKQAASHSQELKSVKEAHASIQRLLDIKDQEKREQERKLAEVKESAELRAQEIVSQTEGNLRKFEEQLRYANSERDALKVSEQRLLSQVDELRNQSEAMFRSNAELTAKLTEFESKGEAFFVEQISKRMEQAEKQRASLEERIRSLETELVEAQQLLRDRRAEFTKELDRVNAGSADIEMRDVDDLVSAVAGVTKGESSNNASKVAKGDEIKQETKVTTSTAKGPANRPRILVAEDNTINQKAIGKLLDEIGCDAIFAVNGREVLERVQRSRYAAILMDCQMPVIDGYEASRGVRMHERQATHRTPIIAMSAHVDVDSEQRCRDAGMDYQLTKPILKSTLLQLLKSCGIDGIGDQVGAAP